MKSAILCAIGTLILFIACIYYTIEFFKNKNIKSLILLILLWAITIIIALLFMIYISLLTGNFSIFSLLF